MVVARIALQRLLVHVEDGVHTGVALHVAGHLPAQRVVGRNDFGQLFFGVVGAPAGTGLHPDGAGRLGVQVREGQRDVSDPGRAVHPDLDPDLALHVVALARAGGGGHLRIGHLVGAQPHRQLATQLLDQRPKIRVERHLRTGGQPGPVEPGALGEQHRRIVLGRDGTTQQREHRGDFLGGAVEFTAGVPAVFGALRVGGLAGQPVELRGTRIEEGLVPGVVDDHQRAIRCDVVEPGQRGLRQAALQQRVPAVQVGAGRSPVSHLAVDGRDDVVGVGDGNGANVDDAVRQRDGFHQRMTVCLNESRHHTAVADIDGLSVRADQRLDVGPIADGDDPPVGDGERLGGRPRIVDGQDGSGDDEVCVGHGQKA